MVKVVIPAYNEEKNISRVIHGLFEIGLKDIVVIDDASTDDTFARAQAAGATVIRHKINRGQGAALETGDEYARRKGSDVVIHFDADDQFNPADAKAAVIFLRENNLDVVLGSRFLDNRSKMPFLKKHLILPISRWINFVFTGVSLSDAHNGFRVLSKKALENIYVTQDRMAHNTEIVRQIKANNLVSKEFPVEVKYHEYGQGVAGGFKIVRELIIDLFTEKN